jgi:hypothetical protein
MRGQHVRDSHQVPLLVFAGIEGILNLLPSVGVLVHHQLLSVVSSVSLL